MNIIDPFQNKKQNKFWFMQQQPDLKCPQHGEQIISSTEDDQIFCLKCLTEIEQPAQQQLRDLLQKKILNLIEQVKQREMRLRETKIFFLTVKEQFIQQLNYILQKIDDAAIYLNRAKKTNLLANYTQIEKRIDVLKTLLFNIRDFCQFNDMIHIIEIVSEAKNADNLIETLNQPNRYLNYFQVQNHYEIRNKYFQDNVVDKFIQMAKKFSKEIMEQTSVIKHNQSQEQAYDKQIEQNEFVELGQFYQFQQLNQIFGCSAIAINRDETILVADQNSLQKIEIWKINEDDSITKVQVLGFDPSQITSLCFSKKENYFFSANKLLDFAIYLWKEEEQGKWVRSQTLQGHKSGVNDIILDNNDQNLISCSDDYTIKIWSKIIKWECHQTLPQHKQTVLFLSLQNDVLASSGCINIRIWIKIDEEWQVNQILDRPENDFYLRVCFIDDQELFATTRCKGRLIRFQKNYQGQFEIISILALNEYEESCSIFSPMIFSEKLGLMVCRHNKNLYILQKKDDGDFKIHQVIQGDYKGIQLLQTRRLLILGDSQNMCINILKMTGGI